MAVPLLDDEIALGVLQVLDRPQRARFTLQEMELLGLFASQAAIALGLLRTAQRARAALAGDGRCLFRGRRREGSRRARRRRREDGVALLRDLERVLAQR